MGQLVVTRYSYAQLEEIWIQAGGKPSMAPLMAAIAEVESGGDPAAENPSGATGLWQLEWPLYAGFVPGATSRDAYKDPRINALAAVKLSRNNPSVTPGSPVYDNWIKWETPPGYYQHFLQGGTAPSGPVPASPGTRGAAQLTAFNPGDLNNLFDAINAAFGSLTAPITGGATMAESLTAIGRVFNAVGGILAATAKDIEWLFHPGNLMRIGAAAGGLIFLIPGMWALLKTGSGQQGDITLALGILLIVIAGVLLFVAFHNLPDTVKTFPDLLGYVSTGIRTQQKPSA